MVTKMSRYREWDLSCKVYVGNLGNSASKHEIESAFSKYGPLRNVWVARNPPGFAFVEFEDPRDAEDAVRGLDGTRCCGTRVRVEMSSGRSRRGGGGRRPGPRYSRSRSRSPRRRSLGRYPRSCSRSPRRSPICRYSSVSVLIILILMYFDATPREPILRGGRPPARPLVSLISSLCAFFPKSKDWRKNQGLGDSLAM
ncbi:RNA-binding protein 1-like isoform X2 [Apis laboriosa]|uniref:RNA-binding protein 1-like isoform X2 n=1 Tax=Apis laboriosa TaxID=183418 RepID=UPI001CC741E7|nr:RNA-binding protein 1-like isoform X2 [Apis laboriosa]